MAGTAGGKRGRASCTKCQKPSAAHFSKGLIIPELKNRARHSVPHTENLRSRCPELGTAEAGDPPRQSCPWTACLRRPAIDHTPSGPGIPCSTSCFPCLHLPSLATPP